MSDLVTIDIAPLFSEDESGWHTTDEQIDEAVRAHGGFVIANFPGEECVDDRAATMLRFFELSDEAKLAVANRSTNPDSDWLYRGYVSALEPGRWAYNEMFDIGPDEPFDAPDVPGMDAFAERNVWPQEEPCTGWRSSMCAYYTQMHRVGSAVMLSAGRAAGFSNDELRARFAKGNSTLRLINYPPKPPSLKIAIDPSEDRSGEDRDIPLAARRHTDAAGVSLLWQAQAGLQAQSSDGTWRDVPRAENSVSVHLGDVLEIMTGGAVPATPHRVIDHGTGRRSIGFFLEPGLDAKLAPIDEAADDGDPRGTYGWHLLERFAGYESHKELVKVPT